MKRTIGLLVLFMMPGGIPIIFALLLRKLMRSKSA